MPGKIKVKILAGRNLPVMDRSGDTTDAYVELKFGNITFKTDVCRKTLNPRWNSEWYRFEVDDAELQDEPLQIRLMDHDTYSANDAIGKVYVNLNPLLLPGGIPAVKNVWTLEAAINSSAGAQGSVMSGWIPVYDTMHGIRGEVNLIVKVELFSDFNKFRQSSCGVQFFYSSNIPYGYHAQVIHGFVEELIVSDDPEYKWIDKIRTPRASNEARQTLFFKLSGEVQRKIGLKALDLGGNAVIGYLQNFDLEGESGIVARGIGTAVTLVKSHDIYNHVPSENNNGVDESVDGHPAKESAVLPLTHHHRHNSRKNARMHLGKSVERLLRSSLEISLETSLDRSSRQLLGKTLSNPPLSRAGDKSRYTPIDTIPLLRVDDLRKDSLPERIDGFLHANSANALDVLSKDPTATPEKKLLVVPRALDHAQSMESALDRAMNDNVNANVYEYSVDCVRSLEESCSHLRDSFRNHSFDSNFSAVDRQCEENDLDPPSTSRSGYTARYTVDSQIDSQTDSLTDSPISRQNVARTDSVKKYPSLINVIDNCPRAPDNKSHHRPFPTSTRRPNEMTSSSSPSYPSLAVTRIVPSSHSPKQSQQQHTLHRRSSDSDLSVTPKGGNSIAGSDRSVTGFLKASTAIVRTMNQDAMEMLEYPFITLQQYPPGFLIHIGGLVSSRSVKLLERISNLEEPEGRDAWWTEIRMEVRSHARALACNVVIGYREETSICDDVCVLSAFGTAALINFHSSADEQQEAVFLTNKSQPMSATVESEKPQKSISKTKNEDLTNHNGKVRHASESNENEVFSTQHGVGCTLCHIPYSENGVPFRVNLSRCAVCKRGRVPDVIFSTIELPDGIPITGRGCFVQANVCKSKKDLRGELNAKEISDCLPFLEYELHSLLLNKVKVKGMNAVFGMKMQVSIGERLVVGMAVGTAVFLTALPVASVPQIASGNAWNREELAEMQRTLRETVKRNREFYCLKHAAVGTENGRTFNGSDTDESEDEDPSLLPELDLGFGARDSYVLEVDDIEDMDRISLLMDDRPPEDFHVVNTQTIPGLEDLEIVRNLQMFTQVSRAKIPSGQVAMMPSKYFARLLQTVYFKLRRMVPCALCNMQFKIALPEQDEIQLSVVGMALGLGEPSRPSSKYKRKVISHSSKKEQTKHSDDNDMIFNLEDDHVDATTVAVAGSTLDNVTNGATNLSATLVQRQRTRSPLRIKTHTMHRHKHVPLKERYGVDITPLSYLPGGRIDRYLGNLNFFFIRESTSIRENGGLSGFMHSFMMEVLAIVRAHITALGGNAMVAFFMTQCVLLHSPHKNQGQCLINVGGDIVSASYFTDDRQSTVGCC